jgi:hypothetical protein
MYKGETVYFKIYNPSDESELKITLKYAEIQELNESGDSVDITLSAYENNYNPGENWVKITTTQSFYYKLSTSDYCYIEEYSSLSASYKSKKYRDNTISFSDYVQAGQTIYFRISNGYSSSYSEPREIKVSLYDR